MTNIDRLQSLMLRRGELSKRYEAYMRQRKVKAAALTFAALCEVTKKILKLEMRAERKRAA